ncbi:cell envelope integrity protein CreD [Megalodesulfovibrio paquesii]
MKPLLRKLSIIGAVLVISALVLAMLESLVDERSDASWQARNDISANWGGAQELAGPVLLIPYKVELRNKSTTRSTANESETVVEHEIVERRLVVAPASTAVHGVLSPSVRSRGIYTVNTYIATLEAKGRFTVEPPVAGVVFRGERVVEVGRPQLVVAVREPRGIEGAPVLAAGDETLALIPGMPDAQFVFSAGFRAELPAGALAAQGGTSEAPLVLPFSLSLRLRGTESLKFIPLGREYAVDLTSSWPHPKFMGAFLPAERSVTEAGFTADWQVTELAMGAAGTIAGMPTGDSSGNWGRLSTNAFGVELYDPVDIYQQTTRAVKYGLLFVLLTFVCFFLVELLVGPPVHCMQYLLVASVLAVFFLLLLSLSEHLGFATAYAAAGAACVALFGFYARHVLRSRVRGGLFGLGLALLYGALYAILQSEDNALLLGSGLVFLALAVTIYVTRSLDWHQLGKEPEFALGSE